MGRAKNIWFTLWIALLLIPAACSVQDHYRVLSFFFDGVPKPDDSKHTDSSKILTNAADSAKLTAKTAGLDLILHPPYRDKECEICHNPGRMGSLKQSMPELCRQCHTNLVVQYDFTHGPVVAGYCTQCHNPHKSKEKNLLIRTGRDLCFYCHNADALFNDSFHDRTDENSCVTCHNPHGSDNHSLLKKGVCYKCHDDFSQKYKMVHGPVSNGNCSACHIPHRKGTERLLVRSGRDLCYYCHDKKQVLKNEKHKLSKDVNCTQCHNPHGGNDRFMLNL
jgi:predicted CXXCH cytochrome family protein